MATDFRYRSSLCTASLPTPRHCFPFNAGGGTYFSCLQRTIKLKKGQVLIHPGDLYHKGVDIKSGIRTLLVCFMDGFDPEVVETSGWSNDDPRWENDVVLV